MSLSDIKLKYEYNTFEDDVINDFYITALSNSMNYDRVSAFFDEKILAFYARGIEGIYNNKGKIRFIFSCKIEEKEYELFKEGYENKIYEQLVEEINYDSLNEEDKKRFANIAFLIEIGMVDVKIAFTNSGIFHSKFGLIYDDTGMVYFRGSNNETVAGVRKNHEMFEVSCDWNRQEEENKKIVSAKNNFENIWHNNVSGLIVMDMPTVLENEIIKYSNGKIINEFEINNFNSMVLDYDGTDFYICNMLINNYDLSKDYYYKKSIKKYIKTVTNNKFVISDSISYLTLIKIQKQLLESSKRYEYNLIVTNKFLEYIESKDIQIDKRKELGKMIKEEREEITNEFISFSEIVNKEMDRKLRDKQMWNALHIVKMVKSANFSVPGSGKTSIVYGAFAYLNSTRVDEVDRIIMIGPKNSFMSWIDEFKENFGEYKEMKILNIHDNLLTTKSKREYEIRFESGSKNLVLINYESMPQLEEVLKEVVDDRCLLVFDEIHRIKKIDGERAKCALSIAKKAKYKVALTGTPIPNTFADIFNVLNILYTDEYSTFFSFSPSILNSGKSDVAREVNKKLYPFFCRISKDDLKVPKPNLDRVIDINMTVEEKKLFEIINKNYSGNTLTLYIRLLQASNNPSLLLNKINDCDNYDLFNVEDSETLEYESIPRKYGINDNVQLSSSERKFIENIGMTSKFWKGIDVIKELVSEGKPVLVWAIFRNTIERIKMELVESNISCEIVYGGTPHNDRTTIITKFKNNKIDVLITNPHTLAESVSLHKCCHDAIYFEYSFNLTHMLQSRDRIHRLGLQDNDYTQYYYLSLNGDEVENDTVDKRTYHRLKEKEKVMMDSIEGESLEPINFDMLEDIKAILSR